MKRNSILTIASLLSIPLMTLHLTSDTVHARVGTAEAGGATLVAVPILILALGIPVIHVMGAGGVFRGQVAKSSPAFLFVWTLHALGVTGMFSLIFSARGLWSPQWGQKV